MSAGHGSQIRSAHWTELDPRVLFGIARLRQDVFVVEQHCPYPDLDDRDLEPTTRQWWIGEPDRSDRVLATLRTLTDPDGADRIGRVATHRSARGRGLAAELMTAAITAGSSDRTVLDAQAHLEHWYARFGFVRAGADFLEDGIAHLPMVRQRS